ncbi:MAG: transcriptional coactivator p15/PC4 family protein [Candidatus Jettenia sp. CY-1]|nr:MAG: transcriptional coactivator p15/PC4 family protein [Candidatus Jettenia sp. CY-1]
MQDNGKVLGEIVKSETEKIVIAEKEYKGRKYIDMRIYFQGDSGDYMPTKKGVTFSPKFIAAVVKILSRGIIKP